MSAQPALVQVLLEGVSDVAAVRAFAATANLPLDDVRLVDLAGITNVRRALADLQVDAPDAMVVGLCDAGEAHVVRRVLADLGYPTRDDSDLPGYGFFVCSADLEEELIRGLGTTQVLAVLEELRLADKFGGLQQQPAWRGRPLADQLHRFCGVASGRKELLAGALAAAASPEQIPEPLRMLLDRIAASISASIFTSQVR
ncbi:hypothetical protein [Calidifontibacter terrae]